MRDLRTRVSRVIQEGARREEWLIAADAAIAECRVEKLVGALERCVSRFHTCMTASGTTEEFADIAVLEYDKLLVSLKTETPAGATP